MTPNEQFTIGFLDHDPDKEKHGMIAVCRDCAWVSPVAYWNGDDVPGKIVRRVRIHQEAHRRAA